jgi:NTE family protein
MSRALVLGGGGSTGVAWLVGMLTGLEAAGTAATQCDLVIGTSAGSIVGARVALDEPLETTQQSLLHRDGALENESVANLDFEGMLKIFEAWTSMPDTSPASCRVIGQMALEVKTMDSARFRELVNADVPQQWPTRQFIATAVDANTGEFVTFGNNDSASLRDAIASSICVPGIFPPAEVNGKRLVDGGLRSGTSADLAIGHDFVLVLAPIGSLSDGMDPGARALAEAEVAMLRENGATVTLVFPDETSNATIGINRMDPTIAESVFEQGKRQGGELGAFMKARW